MEVARPRVPPTPHARALFPKRRQRPSSSAVALSSTVRLDRPLLGPGRAARPRSHAPPEASSEWVGQRAWVGAQPCPLLARGRAGRRRHTPALGVRRRQRAIGEPPLSTSPPLSRSLPSTSQPARPARSSVAARAKNGEVDVDAIVKDLQTKWDGVENKTSVIVYGAGAVVALWLASSVVSAVNAVPLLPKLLELVGLGYTAWFTYRYLLFKSAREELLADVQELKKKITE